MELKVETWPIERLVEYARNPRKNDEQVERMKAAIKEFGFRIPVVAKSDGTLVDGHLRLKAARALGLKEVPVALADELTDTQVRAFRLLANQSANWAEWDSDLLKLELEGLEADGFDCDIIGFDEDTLADLGDVYATSPATEGEQGNLCEIDKQNKCPNCGYEF
jgi:ParB-like chromosome segregation protein Spo0J